MTCRVFSQAAGFSHDLSILIEKLPLHCAGVAPPRERSRGQQAVMLRADLVEADSLVTQESLHLLNGRDPGPSHRAPRGYGDGATAKVTLTWNLSASEQRPRTRVQRRATSLASRS